MMLKKHTKLKKTKTQVGTNYQDIEDDTASPFCNTIVKKFALAFLPTGLSGREVRENKPD